MLKATEAAAVAEGISRFPIPIPIGIQHRFIFELTVFALGPFMIPMVPAIPRCFFSPPATGQPRVSGLLALNPQTQLLESGAVAYTALPPGYKSILEPNRLQILTLEGRPVLELHPGSLPISVQNQLITNQKQIGQAIHDHQEWLDWTAYLKSTSVGQDDNAEMDRLKKIQQLLNSALPVWSAPIHLPSLSAVYGYPVMLNIYIDAPKGMGLSKARIRWFAPDGSVHEHSGLPTLPATDQDYFFHVLLKNFTMAHVQLRQNLVEFEELLREWDRRLFGDPHASF